RAVNPAGRAVECGRAEHGHAFAVGAVTDRASAGVGLLAGLQIDLGAFLKFQAGQILTHISCDVFHTVFTNDCAPSRHHACTAVQNAALDVVGRTAPAPIVIGQVGEAHRAF